MEQLAENQQTENEADTFLALPLSEEKTQFFCLPVYRPDRLTTPGTIYI